MEREVFCRAGFIRQPDLPVTGSEALRARLTALVTTGDDTGDSKRLAEKLKELKNKCKYNKSGLLPQALARQRQLEESFEELTALEDKCAALVSRQREAEIFQKRLQNHLQVLRNLQAEQDARQVAQARRAAERASREKEALEDFCRDLPSRQEARNRLRDLSDYMAAWDAAVKARNALEPEPQEEDTLPAFRGLSARDAQLKAENDAAAYRDSVGKFALVLCVLGILAVVGGLCLAAFAHMPIPGLALGGLLRDYVNFDRVGEKLGNLLCNLERNCVLRVDERNLASERTFLNQLAARALVLRLWRHINLWPRGLSIGDRCNRRAHGGN